MVDDAHDDYKRFEDQVVSLMPVVLPRLVVLESDDHDSYAFRKDVQLAACKAAVIAAAARVAAMEVFSTGFCEPDEVVMPTRHEHHNQQCLGVEPAVCPSCAELTSKS